MATKLRIKLGAVEFEYEGDSDYTPAAIKDLFTHMEELFRAEASKANQGGEAESPIEHASSDELKLHTNSIAAKLSVESGPELALAAATRLQVFMGKPSFTRHELLAEMQSATAHYKKTMSNNLTRTLTLLVSEHKFNQISQSSYSLHANERKRIEAQLAT